jgi:mannan endo-1,4-beta-mannosidase
MNIMKKILFFLIFLLLSLTGLYSQTLVTSVEAETGVLTGVTIAPQSDNSSGPFVTGFFANGDKVTVSVTVPSKANYKLNIRYRSSFGPKAQDVYANGVFVGTVTFPQSANFVDFDAGTVALNAGVNTIAVQKSWGYMDVDKFSIYTMPENVFNVTTSLIDPQANASVKKLYAFLLSQFGKKIISGCTDDAYNVLKTAAGKSPLLRAWDFASYAPMYPWKWDNGGHVFGPVDNHDAENAINWYNATGQKGIVALHWHWGSPSGGTAGTNTFYTKFTTFDVSQAVITGTQQNKDVIRDIDAIAIQLKKLSDAGVPVLWRPLHEAGGAWFWWGAKGSAPAKALWDIMYDRLTNYHNLHNLIWVWSSPEADWYPGNAKVDIMGYDSYPGDFNYTTQKNVFDNLFTITNGEKLIAMSENGPIPDINNAINDKAPWSYFMTWSDLTIKQNTTQHLLDIFANDKVLTLENVSAALPVKLTSFNAKSEGAVAKIEWTTASELNSDRFEIERSSDGTNFYSLVTLKGMGSTQLSHQYFTYDKNPSAGVNYYELNQYDLDGRRTSEGIRTVNFDGLKTPSVRAYPNPAQSNLGILLSNYKGKKVTLVVNDMAGKMIHSEEITTPNGQGYYKLNLTSPIANGQYVLQVKGEALIQSIKVLLTQQ